jgi:hypothetical protein
MPKHASKFSVLQVVEPTRTICVRIPYPILDAIVNAGDAFLDL